MIVIGRKCQVSCQFDDSGVVAIDAQFRRAGQHAVAFDAFDDLLAERHIDRAQAGAAVGRAANYRFDAVVSGCNHRFDVLAHRLDRDDARFAAPSRATHRFLPRLRTRRS